jgi:hypothetical protein
LRRNRAPASAPGAEVDGRSEYAQAVSSIITSAEET